ncbi:hypothetical protein N9B73_11030 [Verrucomicrobiales bacterium]|nr:hypothetical protein [Verrucomicrobiales bacterium]
MRRYVLTSLAIGCAVSVLVLTLLLVGAFESGAAWLEEFYVSRGFFDSDEYTRVRWLEIIVIAMGAVGVAWCVVDVSLPAQKILVALSILFVSLCVSPAMALYNVLFEPFSTMVSVFLAAGAGLVFAGTEKGMRKRVLEETLGDRVSREVFDGILAAPEPPDFAGSLREVTVLTCRLFNHSELRGKLEPTDLMGMNNLFIRSVSNFLKSRGGYLDESGPEMVRAFFGLHGAGEDHAVEACRAALELRSRLKNLSQECETRWFQKLHYGVGIETGEMTVGVYGANQRRSFSAIGADTDYSRRLAHANHRYGSDLLIGPDTFRRVEGRFDFRPMEMFYDPENDVLTEIYQLMGEAGSASEEEKARRDLFWKGVIYLREKKYEEALKHLSKAKNPSADDGPLAFFLGLAQDGISAPDTKAARNLRQLTEKGHARLSNLM